MNNIDRRPRPYIETNSTKTFCDINREGKLREIYHEIH